ncbi:hypothetical protein [Mycoplasma sp. Ms02]|nr:hypothetical protein [Mycoplasma sp. Ms02]QZE12446.1 hypothetical protein K4L35_00425 [Mycoplasma sp. Ms02]
MKNCIKNLHQKLARIILAVFTDVEYPTLRFFVEFFSLFAFDKASLKV